MLSSFPNNTNISWIIYMHTKGGNDGYTFVMLSSVATFNNFHWFVDTNFEWENTMQ
jgi:hypothetical protein